MLLVSGATKDVQAHREVGILLRPGAGVPSFLESRPWAIDNAAFTDFDADAFVELLGRCKGRRGCLFAVAPDVVGNHAKTLRRWRLWAPMMRVFGFPLAFVAQDGCDVSSVPWDEIDALFIGGTTEFKLSAMADDLLAYAAARGKWRHVGRVNSRRRIKRFASRCDSIDGTGFSKHGRINIPKGLRWTEEARINQRFW